MTDRFYPVGQPGHPDMWKTTYEVANEMRSFERSPYPPGCAVHLPGSREKFGFSTPGPIAHRLSKPELCLTEDTDIDNPRAHQAIPRYQVPNDREVFDNFDVPEMQRSYQSPVATMSFSGGGGLGGTGGGIGIGGGMGSSIGFGASRTGGMNRSLSLPQLQPKSVTRLHQPKSALTKLDDQQFTYFIPKAMQRDGKERLMASNLSKLQKEAKVTMPFGDGTGFRTQNANCDWYPSGWEHTVPTTSQAAYTKPPFYRMSPLQCAKGDL